MSNRRDKQARLSFWPGTELCVDFMSTVLGAITTIRIRKVHLGQTWMMLVSLFLSGWFGYEDCGHPHNSAYGTRWFYDCFSFFNSGSWCFAWFLAVLDFWLIQSRLSGRSCSVFLFLRFCVFKAGPGRSAHVWFWFCLACLFVYFSVTLLSTFLVTFLSFSVLFPSTFSLLWIDWFNLRCFNEVRITLCHARMT